MDDGTAHQSALAQYCTIVVFGGDPDGFGVVDGRVAGFLRMMQRERNSSYDRTPIERISGLPSGAEDEILDQLEALGYLERGESD